MRMFRPITSRGYKVLCRYPPFLRHHLTFGFDLRNGAFDILPFAPISRPHLVKSKKHSNVYPRTLQRCPQHQPHYCNPPPYSRRVGLALGSNSHLHPVILLLHPTLWLRRTTWRTCLSLSLPHRLPNWFHLLLRDGLRLGQCARRN